MTPLYESNIENNIFKLIDKRNFKTNDIYCLIGKIIISKNYDNISINYYDYYIESVKIIYILIKTIQNLQLKVKEFNKNLNNDIIIYRESINNNNDDSQEKCCICMVNEKEYAYINCGHMCVCKDCQIGEWINKCPLCKIDGDCIKIFK